MNDLRTAAQQALEALESTSWRTHKGDRAITTLRDALAEPAQEPVALIHTWRKNGRPHAELLDWGVGVAALPDGKHTLYTAPPKAEPKSMHPELRKMWEEYFDKCFRAMPVPQRKPLTEGVLMGVYIDFDRTADPAWSGVEYLLRLCRAIERAHGIV